MHFQEWNLDGKNLKKNNEISSESLTLGSTPFFPDLLDMQPGSKSLELIKSIIYLQSFDDMAP